MKTTRLLVVHMPVGHIHVTKIEERVDEVRKEFESKIPEEWKLVILKETNTTEYKIEQFYLES